MVYCEKYGPIERKDPDSQYNDLLFEQGRTHEKQVVETNYPEAEKLEFATPVEGFKLLLEGMARGSKALCGLPAFYLPEGLEGVFDILEKRKNESSVFGSYHYIVKEVKLARNIQRQHIYQAAFYNYLLGKVQGYTPSAFCVINRDGIEQEIEYDEKVLLEILEDVREILKGKKVCNPTYGACHWPWESYNNDEAIRIRDVSLVSGVGPSFKQKLVQRNVFTVEDLAKTPLKDLTCIKGIGEKTATKFLNNSKALVSGKHIRLGSCQFPEKKVEIFLDLEGTGEQVQDEELVAIH